MVELVTNRKLKQEFIDWKAKSVDKIVNVGLDILGNTLIANTKQRVNHCICFVIDITKAKIYYYYNTLGLKILLNLNKRIELIIALVKIRTNVSLEAFFLKVFNVKKHIVRRPNNAMKSAPKIVLFKIEI